MHLMCGIETDKGGVRPIDVRKKLTNCWPRPPTTGRGGTVPPFVQRPATCLRPTPGAGVPPDLPLHRLGPAHNCYFSVFAQASYGPLSVLFHLE